MKVILKSTITLTMLSALILAGGCQTPEKGDAAEPCSVCPQCEMKTATTPIQKLTYTKHICPMCKSIETDAAQTSAALAAYTGMDIETVPVCKHCKAVVTPCPGCSK